MVGKAVGSVDTVVFLVGPVEEDAEGGLVCSVEGGSVGDPVGVLFGDADGRLVIG